MIMMSNTGVATANPIAPARCAAPVYAKTPKAWELLPQPDLLGRKAHTLILMANGRRSLRELSVLIGENAGILAQRLQQQGYLKTQSVEMIAPEA